MTVIEWLPLAAVCLMGAMSPGPSLVVVVKHTINGGKRHGLITAWTHALGVGVYATITVFGLVVLLSHNPNVFKAVTLAGAVYLAWLGVTTLLAARHPSSTPAETTTASKTTIARDGLLTALLNPKIAVFFAALFSQFVGPANSTADKWLMAGIAFSIDGLWYTVVALLLSRPLVLTRFQAQRHWVNRVCGVLFIAVAARIAVI